MNRSKPIGAAVALCFTLTGTFAVSACSTSNPDGASPFVDGGLLTEAGSQAVIGSLDGGAALKLWPPPGTATCSDPNLCPGDPGPNAVYVTVSGESNALLGYPFPPGDFQTDTYMFDGWEIHILEYIVNLDDVILWSNPNADPTNQGDLGKMTQVAHLSGPFVVDLHKGGRIIGQGGAPEEATPIGVIVNQNDNGNRPFDPTTTYGLGFGTVQASYDAYNVNLDESEAADFALMVEKGYSVLYVGTAEWKGDQSTYGCTQTSAGPGPEGGTFEVGDAAVVTYADGGYDFTKMPQSGMTFKLGFATPTSYRNCQNMALQGTPNLGEDYPRGVQTSTSQSVVAQLTLHMDHPFWESFAEDTPIHWDQVAARYVGQANPEAHVEDMVGVPFYAFTDKSGTPLPWRNCSGSYYTPPNGGQMSFSTLTVPVNPHGTCVGTIGRDYTTDDCRSERDYFDFIRYTQSTQGHLNSQGLCFIDRQWPAPGGGS